MPKKLWEIFITFFKIGAFTFGGGYAMIPLVQHEIVESKGYITEDEFMKIIAIAEATPGVIAVNTATFVGYKVAGVIGGIVGTLGVVLPSFVIISVIARFYVAFRSIQWIDWAFSGIQAGVIVLIIGALIKMVKKSDKTWLVLCIALLGFGIAAFTNINVIFVILFGAAAGLIRNLVLCRKASTEEAESILIKNNNATDVSGDSFDKKEKGGELQ